MEQEIEITGDVAIVTIEGSHLDVATHMDFRHNVAAVLAKHPKVIFDIGGLKFMDSSGISLLLSSMRKARSNGGDLKICCVTAPVNSVFELVRMHQLVGVYDNREEAIASFAAGQT